MLMQNRVTILHNPKCSKSREALKILRQNNIEPLIIEYLETLLTAETLQDILEKLKANPRDIMRKKEKPFIEYNLANETLTKSELIDAIIKHPILLERPIAITNKKAIIGRPPQAVLNII